MRSPIKLMLFSNQFSHFTPSWFRSMWKNQDGSVAVIIALAVLPLLLAAGVAVDFARSLSLRASLQVAADAAVLSAASRKVELVGGVENGPAPSALARLVFNKRFADTHSQRALRNVRFNIVEAEDDTESGRFTAEITAKYKTTLISFITETVDLGVRAVSIYDGQRKPVCVLSLHNNPAVGSLSLSGTADIIAPDCAVHSNSNLTQSGSSDVTSAGNCASGSTTGGNFSPAAVDGCAIQGDPFFARMRVFFEEAYAQATTLCTGAEAPLEIVSGDTLVVGPSTTLHDGQPTQVTCGGLTVKSGGVVELAAGSVLAIFGPINIQAGGSVNGTNTALIALGPNGGLNIQANSNVTISAPVSGLSAVSLLRHNPATVACRRFGVGMNEAAWVFPGRKC